MRRAFAVLLTGYVVWLVVAYQYHFIDGVNLLLHEAGHLFFMFLGQTMHFLGGTLGQLFFPVAMALYFLRRGDRFATGVCTVWLAESLMYTARYMSDARAMRLPLVGGHIHDWNWLFAKWGVLRQCESIGGTLHVLASLLAVVAVFYCLRQTTWFARPVRAH